MARLTKEEDLIRIIKVHAKKIDEYQNGINAHVKQMLGLVDYLKAHTKNRISAHKAHLTMARNKISKV